MVFLKKVNVWFSKRRYLESKKEYQPKPSNKVGRKRTTE